MATTTNYSWSTPDDTSLVKDGAAAIRTLGSSIDTTTKALNPSTTLGDIEYRSATANTNTRLGIGSTGQVLTVSGGVPTWASPAGGGKVLQVVNATTTTAATNTTTTYADSNLTASITPTSSTSKILVLVTQGVGHASATQGLKLQLMRNSTSISVFGAFAGFVLVSGTYAEVYGSYLGVNYLDSPATTSAVTYKTQFAIGSGTTGTTYCQGQGERSSITLLEIGA